MSTLAPPTSVRFQDLTRPFSNFDYVESSYSASLPIRRLFSIARSKRCHTLIEEEVLPEACVADENAELASLFPDFKCGPVRRLSFWKSRICSLEELVETATSDCIGYAILKYDEVPSADYNRWNLFEAIVSRYDHHHNYLPTSRVFSFRVGPTTQSISGTVYCQQNSLNKWCAHAALRSVCATYLGDLSISYSEINRRAGNNPAKTQGLSSVAIRLVLESYGIPFEDFVYNATSNPPFALSKLLYSGIESGCGALLGFELEGPRASEGGGHIIPFLGHTFNQDTWVPLAHNSYFLVGEAIKFIPSDAWTSSFIVHDDNFGMNMVVPKTYLGEKLKAWVVTLLPRGYHDSGAIAEVIASQYFYSLVPNIFSSAHASRFRKNRWIQRLLNYTKMKMLILRTVPINKQQYIAHLKEHRDWDGQTESAEVLRYLEEIQPTRMWMTELSVPDLFSTNLRKIGELLLNGEKPLGMSLDYANFVLARFPGTYLFFKNVGDEGKPVFESAPSNFTSHLRLWRAKKNSEFSEDGNG